MAPRSPTRYGRLDGRSVLKIITANVELERHLCELTRRHDKLSWAVAWASVGFRAAQALTNHNGKIEKLVVGTHFHQTHPDFMVQFVEDERVRFVLNPNGVFHPKVYLFRSADSWEAIIGSANFTASAMNSNDEVATLISNTDDGAAPALDTLVAAINGYWDSGGVLTRSNLEGYRAMWRKNRKRLELVAGQFSVDAPNKKSKKKLDGGKSALEVPILRLPWEDYFQQVQDDKHHSLEGRREILRHFREWFASAPSFSAMTQHQRKRIAGTTTEDPDPIDWRWFGSMTAAGNFKKLIKENSDGLSAALDEVPLEGDVSREQFIAFTERFSGAFEGLNRGGGGVATATRLLAMKRPDVFVCVDSKNQRDLCKAFGIGANLSFQRYWDGIVARIQEAAWWQPPEPTDPVQRDVWRCRAALLDALYYEP